MLRLLAVVLIVLPMTIALPTDNEGNGSNLELVLVQVVTRHGARSPYVLFGDEVGIQWNCTAHPAGSFGTSPSSSLNPRNRFYAGAYVPDVQVLHGNCAQGELTEQGSEMHVSLGQTNAQRYKGFLPPSLNASQIHVRSTAVPRTVESAASFLSGLYPESTGQSGVELQTIWMIEEPNDNMQLPSNCNLINQLCNAVQSSPEWIARLTAMKPLQQKLAAEWGIPVSEFPVWTNIQSTLQCRTAAGVPNPSYLTQADYDSIIDLANWMMAQLWNNTRSALLINGPLLNELSGNMKQAMVETGLPIFRLFSAHDTTIGPLLAGLGAFPKDWPPFAANVNLELYRSTTDSDSWFVRGLYLGDVISFGGHCAEYCPFSEFLAITRPVTVDFPGRTSYCNSVGFAAPLNDYTSFLC